MVNVFILNLLVFRALRGHHMDHSGGLERQGNSARIFLLASCWRTSGDLGAAVIAAAQAVLPPTNVLTFDNVSHGGRLRYNSAHQDLSCAVESPYAPHCKAARFPVLEGFRARRLGAVPAARTAKSE
jgi:hypothetical protein